MSTRKGIDRTVLSALVLGSLVLLNILGLRHFVRLDLTRDGRFTLGEATVETLQNLRDPVTIRAFFTSDLPPPFSTNARYVRDLLEEYHSMSDGAVRFEFVDPVSAETEEDKDKKKDVKRDIFGRAVRESTSVEQEMQALGIPSVQVQVNEDDKLEVKRAYMGIAVQYGDETEVIPMVQSTEGLEYDLTTLVRKLSREETPKVGFLVGHQGPDPGEKLRQALGLLSQLYELQPVDLSAEEATVPEGLNALLVIGPATPLSESEQRALDSFIASGGAVAFLLDRVAPDLRTFTTTDADHGLDDLLQTYGVTIEPGLVIDAEAATINVEQQRGFMRIAQPIRYPLVPQPKRLDPEHPLTRGLSQVVFPFMSPIAVSDDAQNAEVLVESSEKSWVQQAPHDLNPGQEWSGLALDDAEPHPLVVALSGPLPRHFADDGSNEEPSGDARVVVIGGSTFIQDQFFSAGNQALVMNLMDWLVLDEALLAIRARGLAAAPLEELDEGQRATVRYANVVGLPLAFVLFGIVRWRMRERRRTLVHV